jgi:predicted nucleotidyltransferase
MKWYLLVAVQQVYLLPILQHHSIRVTKDVDAIVQVASLVDYHRLSEKLRKKGFQEDMSDGAPICRWKADSVILDVMPTDSKILGFGNHWYVPATKNAVTIQLPSGKTIKMVSAPYFLITKLEAFDGRGAGDFLMSHDIEDIITVLDGRPKIIDEVKSSDAKLVNELAKRFSILLNNNQFVDAVYGHMPIDPTSQARVPKILKMVQQIAETNYQ